jgi:predicted dehydrogenase
MLKKDMGASTRPLRFGVAGLGYWGPNLVRNLHELPDAELKQVADLRADARERIARRYPEVRATERFEDLLEDSEIDAVCIATPISTHYELGRAALLAGKHVFIEKPLAASSTHAAELLALGEAEGLTVMPGHTFLYSPPVVMIHQMIESGELGEIYSVSTSRVNLGLHQSDASVVWDLGPHDFSILRYVLDESPATVSAVSRGCIIPETPDVAFIQLEFATGTIASVELSWLAPSKLRRTTIIGSRKMVVYDDVSNEPVRVFDSGVILPDPETFGQYKLSYRTGDIVSPHVESAEPLFLELEDFCDAVRSGSTPRSSAQLGVDVVRVVEAVDASLERGGARVRVADRESVTAS